MVMAHLGYDPVVRLAVGHARGDPTAPPWWGAVQYQARTSWCRLISADATEPVEADVVSGATVDHHVGQDPARPGAFRGGLARSV